MHTFTAQKKTKKKKQVVGHGDLFQYCQLLGKFPKIFRGIVKNFSRYLSFKYLFRDFSRIPGGETLNYADTTRWPKDLQNIMFLCNVPILNFFKLVGRNVCRNAVIKHSTRTVSLSVEPNIVPHTGTQQSITIPTIWCGPSRRQFATRSLVRNAGPQTQENRRFMQMVSSKYINISSFRLKWCNPRRFSCS
jgi:hypothetical protein